MDEEKELMESVEFWKRDSRLEQARSLQLEEQLKKCQEDNNRWVDIAIITGKRVQELEHLLFIRTSETPKAKCWCEYEGKHWVWKYIGDSPSDLHTWTTEVPQFCPDCGRKL